MTYLQNIGIKFKIVLELTIFLPSFHHFVKNILKRKHLTQILFLGKFLKNDLKN